MRFCRFQPAGLLLSGVASKPCVASRSPAYVTLSESLAARRLRLAPPLHRSLTLATYMKHPGTTEGPVISPEHYKAMIQQQVALC